ncbi:hypothetical protein AADZ91_03970 [Colwelliaceae bacterium 6441]
MKGLIQEFRVINNHVHHIGKIVTKLFVVLLITSYSHASYSAPRGNDEIVIGLGNFEPLFSKPDSPALFKDLIDGVYQYLPNRNVNYRYMLSNARLVKGLNDKTLDGAANIFSQQEINGCLTQPVFTFSDVAISKRAHYFRVDDIKALSEFSLVSYQRATVLLGNPYKQEVEKAAYYKEVPHPAKQAQLLATDLVDISIGDKYIFFHSLKAWSKGRENPKNYVIHNIFPPVSSAMGFRLQAHCDEFDQALVKYKESGGYQAVYDKHLSRLGFID